MSQALEDLGRKPEPPPSPRIAGWVSLLRTVRAPLFLLVGAGIALLLPPQTEDMLDALSDGDFNDAWVTASFNVALAVLALTSWYWSRALLAARFNIPDTMLARREIKEADPGLDGTALDFVPRIIFVLALLIGLGVIVRSSAWSSLPYLVAWAIPVSFVVFYRLRVKTWLRYLLRLGAENPTPTGEGMRKTPSVRAWWSHLRTRFRMLLERTPFSEEISGWPAFAAVTLCLFAFVFGALESFGFFNFLLGATHEGFPSLLARVFPGPSVVLLALALMIPPFAVLTFLFDGLDIRFLYMNRPVGFSRPPIILALLIWTMAMPGFFDLHTVRIIEPSDKDADKRISIAERAKLEAFFTDWVMRCAPADPGKPVRPVIVAISGGASRAAVWGARTLQQVESSSGTGKPTIFAVSSVSGGSLGTAAYFSLLSQLSSAELCTEGTTGARQMQAANLASPRLARDALGPLMAGALFVDFPRAMFAPFAAIIRTLAGTQPRGGDRAEAIERAFERLWRVDAASTDTIPVNGNRPGSGTPVSSSETNTVLANATAADSAAPAAVPAKRQPAKRMDFSEPFLSMFYDGKTIRSGMPLWIANGTDMNTGARFLTVPFSPQGEWPFRAATDTLSALGADVPISTAINNTARFPYLEPSGELLAYRKAGPVPHLDQDRPSDLGGQIIDGGYFENDGLQTALDLARWLEQKGPSLIGNRMVQPIIVQATADGSAAITIDDIVRCGSRPDDHTYVAPSQRPLQLTAPIFGLYNVRSAHTAVLLREATDAYCAEAKRFFHFFLIGNSGTDVPLNWILSDRTARYIWSAMDAKGSGNTAEHDSLTAAFNAQ